MKAHSKEIREQVLELLIAKRSHKEIENRTGILSSTIEDWAIDWRKEGKLIGYIKPGMEFSQRAKNMSNGYYPVLRKKYLSMKWTDKIEDRVFGFENTTQAIHYYLDNDGNPMPCAYCGIFPPEGKVWGLDRIDSVIGHIPGNLVPCCSSSEEGAYLSCQTSKSKFTLYNWMERNLSRSLGKRVNKDEVENRLKPIYELANSLKQSTK